MSSRQHIAPRCVAVAKHQFEHFQHKRSGAGGKIQSGHLFVRESLRQSKIVARQLMKIFARLFAFHVADNCFVFARYAKVGRADARLPRRFLHNNGVFRFQRVQ